MASWIGSREDLDSSTFERIPLSSYLLVDLEGQVPLNRTFSAFLGLKNLLDEQYQEIAGFGAPGINAFVGVEGRF